jgi:hypothetical protein
LLFFIGTGLNIPFFGVWPYGQEGIPPLFLKKKKRAGKVFLTKRIFETKKVNKKKTFLKQKMQTCCLARREGIPGRDFLSMVRSSGSNNCSIRRIEPWLTKKANLFLFAFFVSKIFFLFAWTGRKGHDNNLPFTFLF